MEIFYDSKIIPKLESYLKKKQQKKNKTQTKFLGIETTDEKYIEWNKNKLGISEERIHRLGDIAIKTTQKDTRGKKRQKILNRASLS